MKRIIILVISAVLLATALSGVTSLASTATRVYDSAELLNDTSAARVDAALADAEARTGYSFRLYTTTVYYVSEGKMLSELGFTDDDDLVVLSIEYYGGSYYYELFTFGDVYAMISDSDADRILDDDRVYAIKRGRIETSAVAFASITADTIETNKTTRRVAGIAVPILLALLTAGIFIGVVCYTYKRKLKSPIYPVTKYATLSLTESTDNYITSTVTRVRIQSSSSSRGGSRGGGSRGRR